MQTSQQTRSGGTGFLGLLTLLFIALKLLKKIAWSWWWVLSPLWIPFAAFLAIVVAVAFIVSLGKVIAWVFARRAYNKRIRAEAIRQEQRKREAEVTAARVAKQAASDERNAAK